MIRVLAGRDGGAGPIRGASTARVARALRAQGMPAVEIRSVLSTEDPAVVHRFLELHEERLEERHGDRVRAIREIERSLTASLAGLRRSPRPALRR